MGILDSKKPLEFSAYFSQQVIALLIPVCSPIAGQSITRFFGGVKTKLVICDNEANH